MTKEPEQCDRTIPAKYRMCRVFWRVWDYPMAKPNKGAYVPGPVCIRCGDQRSVRTDARNRDRLGSGGYDCHDASGRATRGREERSGLLLREVQQRPTTPPPKRAPATGWMGTPNPLWSQFAVEPLPMRSRGAHSANGTPEPHFVFENFRPKSAKICHASLVCVFERAAPVRVWSAIVLFGTFHNPRSQRSDLRFRRTTIAVSRNKSPDILSDTEEVTGSIPVDSAQALPQVRGYF
jgi:hypothetical protein